MSLVKKNSVIAVLISVVINVSGTMIFAKSLPQLLFIACDGKLSISNEERDPSKLVEKIWLGDVPRGFLYGGYFFASDKNKLVSSNLFSKKSVILADLQGVIDNNYTIWQIGYVDETFIYFSTLKYDKSVSIGRQEKNSLIFRFDRTNKEIIRIEVKDCGSPFFSVYDGKIYFVDLNGEIKEFIEGKIKFVGFKGRFPSISPDGKRIAFASFGLINDHVYVYDFNAKKNISLINFFGPEMVNPIIRWSKNSDRIAVEKKSDLKLGQLYIVNTSDKSVVQKIEDSYACNWFFMDE